jgi:hypothetical protein
LATAVRRSVVKYGCRQFQRQTTMLWADSRGAGWKVTMCGRPTPNRQRCCEIFVTCTKFKNVAGGCIIQLAARVLTTNGITCNDDRLWVDEDYSIRKAYYFIQVWKYCIFIRLAVVSCGCLKNLYILMVRKWPAKSYTLTLTARFSGIVKWSLKQRHTLNTVEEENR